MLGAIGRGVTADVASDNCFAATGKELFGRWVVDEQQVKREGRSFCVERTVQC